MIVNPDLVRSSDEEPTAPFVLLGFKSHVMTVAQAEVAVNAAMQQNVRSRRVVFILLFFFAVLRSVY